jgi:hypothetical protein
MEPTKIDNIIKVFESLQKGNEKKEKPEVAFAETMKRRPKKIEEEVLLKEGPAVVEGKGVLREDTVSISKEAKEAYKLVRIVKIVREAPDVRQDKLEKARRDLEKGLLFLDEVNRAIAEKLYL